MLIICVCFALITNAKANVLNRTICFWHRIHGDNSRYYILFFFFANIFISYAEKFIAKTFLTEIDNVFDSTKHMNRKYSKTVEINL